MPVDNIAGAIRELSGLVREWIKSTPTRNLKNAVRNADKYIRTIEDDTLSDDKRKKLLYRYKYRFNKYKLG